ncbi:MAG: thioredoxin domain-containing protein [Anaerolineae bacterium]|nr:thioredoxin domain-containing protein [Anaerolineae bacterium]
MLYDESQLARVYLHAWQVTSNEFFRTITEEILDYVAREMTSPEGGFYSTQDADSEGEEGKFFVWTPGEIREVLGDDAQADEFMSAYGVTRHGNFEGKNILEFVGDMNQRAALAEARRALFEAREKRVHPGRDEKVLTSWNGLMLAAFAEAARALDRDDYRQVAERNADFLLRELRQGNGRLLRTWKACPEGTEGTGEAKLNGYLEDYSYLIEGLQELYQTTFEPRHADIAERGSRWLPALPGRRHGGAWRPGPGCPAPAGSRTRRGARRSLRLPQICMPRRESRCIALCTPP